MMTQHAMQRLTEVTQPSVITHPSHQNQTTHSSDIGQEFTNAVMRGELYKVRALIAKYDVSTLLRVQFADGNTLLHLAVSTGNPLLIEELIEAGADLEAQNEYGNTPIHIAVNLRAISAIMALISAGANVNSKNNYHNTPLFNAVFSGSPGVVSILLNHGAKVDEKYVCDAMPVHLAIIGGHPEVLKILINHGADINSEENEKPYINNLAKTILAGSATYLTDILHNVNSGIPLLHLAVMLAITEDRINLVRLLVANGAVLNARDSNNNTPLYYAAMNNNVPVIEILTNAGADQY